MSTAERVVRRAAIATLVFFAVLLIAQTCVREANARRPLPLPIPVCIVHYAFAEQTLHGGVLRAYVEVDRPVGGLCVLDLRSAKP